MWKSDSGIRVFQEVNFSDIHILGDVQWKWGSSIEYSANLLAFMVEFNIRMDTRNLFKNYKI